MTEQESQQQGENDLDNRILSEQLSAETPAAPALPTAKPAHSDEGSSSQPPQQATEEETKAMEVDSAEKSEDPSAAAAVEQPATHQAPPSPPEPHQASERARSGSTLEGATSKPSQLVAAGADQDKNLFQTPQHEAGAHQRRDATPLTAEDGANINSRLDNTDKALAGITALLQSAQQQISFSSPSPQINSPPHQAKALAATASQPAPAFTIGSVSVTEDLSASIKPSQKEPSPHETALKEQLREAEQQAARYHDMALAEEREKVRMESILLDIKVQRTEAVREKKEAEEELTRTRRQLNSGDKYNAKLNAELEQLRENADADARTIAEFSQNIEDITTERSLHNNDRTAAVNAAVEAAEARAKEAQAQAVKAAVDKAINEQVREHQAVVEALQQEHHNAMREQLTTLNAEVDQCKSDCEQAILIVETHARADIKAARERSPAEQLAQDEIANYKSSLATVTYERGKFANQLQATKSRVQELEAEVGRMRTAQQEADNAARNRIRQLREEKEAIEEAKLKMEAELSIEKKDHGELRADNEKLSSDLTKAITNNNELKDAIRNTLSNSNSSKKQLKVAYDMVKKLSKELKEKETELQNLREEIAGFSECPIYEEEDLELEISAVLNSGPTSAEAPPLTNSQPNSLDDDHHKPSANAHPPARKSWAASSTDEEHRANAPRRSSNAKAGAAIAQQAFPLLNDSTKVRTKNPAALRDNPPQASVKPHSTNAPPAKRAKSAAASEHHESASRSKSSSHTRPPAPDNGRDEREGDGRRRPRSNERTASTHRLEEEPERLRRRTNDYEERKRYDDDHSRRERSSSRGRHGAPPETCRPAEHHQRRSRSPSEGGGRKARPVVQKGNNAWTNHKEKTPVALGVAARIQSETSKREGTRTATRTREPQLKIGGDSDSEVSDSGYSTHKSSRGGSDNDWQKVQKKHRRKASHHSAEGGDPSSPSSSSSSEGSRTSKASSHASSLQPRSQASSHHTSSSSSQKQERRDRKKDKRRRKQQCSPLKEEDEDVPDLMLSSDNDSDAQQGRKTPFPPSSYYRPAVLVPKHITEMRGVKEFPSTEALAPTWSTELVTDLKTIVWEAANAAHDNLKPYTVKPPGMNGGKWLDAFLMFLTHSKADSSVAKLEKVIRFNSHMRSNKLRIKAEAESRFDEGQTDEQVWDFIAGELYIATGESAQAVSRTAMIGSAVFDTKVKMEPGLNFLASQIKSATALQCVTQNWSREGVKMYEGMATRSLMRIVANHWMAELKQEYAEAERSFRTSEHMSPDAFVHLCLANQQMRDCTAHAAREPATHTADANGQVVPISKNTPAPASSVPKQQQPTPASPPSEPPRIASADVKAEPRQKVDSAKKKRGKERGAIADFIGALGIIDSGDKAQRYPRRGNSNIKRGVCWNCREANHMLYDCTKALNFTNLKEARDSYTLNSRLYNCVPMTQAQFDSGKIRWKEVLARRSAGKTGQLAYFSD
jgi:hypothetical protein